MSLSTSSIQFPGNAIWQLQGNATLQGNVLQLTPGAKYQAGAGYLQGQALNTASGFSTNFSFTLDETDILGGADGIAWIIRSTQPSQNKVDLSFYGGNSPSLTVHFDSYPNIPVWNEPNSNFIAVYRDQKLVFSESICNVLLPDLNFRDGTPWYVWMSQVNRTLSVSYSKSNTPPTTPQLICNNVNITDILGPVDQVYQGFIGLTGEAFNRQSVTSFSTTSCPYPGSQMVNGACKCPLGQAYPVSGSSLYNYTCYPPTSNTGLSIGAIVGIVVACLAVLIGLGLGIFFWNRKKKSTDKIQVMDYPKEVAKVQTSPREMEKAIPSLIPVTNVVNTPPSHVVLGQSEMSDVTSVDAHSSYSQPAPYSQFLSQHLDFSNRSYSVRQTGMAMDEDASARLIGQTLKVVRTFIPEMEDEIVLNKGDKILVDEVFEDGWCVGTNLSTKAHGLFPLAVVALV